MMDATQDDVIPQRLDPENKPRAVGWSTWRRSPMSTSAAVSKVLSGDDLLIEILFRVNFPTTLVRAALVCRRWLRHASDPAFLRRFHELNLARLLGFYVNPGEPRTTPRFVTMLPQPPELAAVIRRASCKFDTYRRVPSVSTYILDCKNGSIFFCRRDQRQGSGFPWEVHNRLCPERGIAIVPAFPLPQPNYFYSYYAILSKEEGGSMSYLNVLVQSTMERSMTERQHTAHVYMLRDGVWCMLNSAIDQIPPPRPEPKAVLIDNKIYMAAVNREIIVLDLTASDFSTIQLPQEVEYGLRNTMLSQAECAAGIYLVHVKELQLSIWLHKGGNWLLVDTIFLRDMCATLSVLVSNTSPHIKHVGDNAEFVFLEMGGCVLFLDVKCRKLRKVYEITNNDRGFGEIYPFTMIWPPTFPLLKDDT